MRPFIRTSLAIVPLVLVALLLGGCSAGMQEVAESSSWFHVRIPAKWIAQSDPGSLMLYSDEKLPEDEAALFDHLSVQVFTSNVASETPVPDELTYLIGARAKSRGWTGEKIGKPEQVVVGKRPGYAADVSATDSSGRPFTGRIALVRTNNREALIVAMCSPDGWAVEKTSVDELFDEWYWHQPVKTETDAEDK